MQCVVFDLDDTLYLERDYVRSGFDAVGAWAAKHLGINHFSEQSWAFFEAGHRGDIFDRVLLANHLQPAPELIESMVQEYRRHDPEIALLPDARTCLEQLHGLAHIAVVTDGPSVSQRNKVAVLRLKEWTDLVVYTAEHGDGNAKPSPHCFRMVEQALGCDPLKCWYFADNPAKDFYAPLQLGWKTGWVRRCGGLYADRALPAGQNVDFETDNLERAASRVLINDSAAALSDLAK